MVFYLVKPEDDINRYATVASIGILLGVVAGLFEIIQVATNPGHRQRDATAECRQRLPTWSGSPDLPARTAESYGKARALQTPAVPSAAPRLSPYRAPTTPWLNTLYTVLPNDRRVLPARPGRENVGSSAGSSGGEDKPRRIADRAWPSSAAACVPLCLERSPAECSANGSPVPSRCRAWCWR